MVVGKGAGGNVMVTVDGNQQCQGVKIDGEMDNEKIAKGVKDALNDASKKLQRELATKMKEMGGLDAFKDMLG
jgi:DNA-binding protein YbaB